MARRWRNSGKQLKKNAEARKNIDAVEQWLRKRTASGQPPLRWEDRLEVELLLREAKGVVRLCG
jgi:hypothetical protein